MKIPTGLPRVKGFRYPREIVACAVWAYHRFATRTSDVEDLLAERGVIVSREAVRLWVTRLGRHFATCLRQDRPRPNHKWHLDEVAISIRGKTYWLWRAIDPHGDGLDILVQTRRNGQAAKRAFQRLITQFGEPRVEIPDKLRGYIKPIETRAPDTDHRAHRSTRKREKIFGGVKSHRQAQRVLTAHDQISVIFRPRRYQLSAISYRQARADAFSLWAGYTAEMTA